MNITEIAKLANVSVSTVSKVMNNRDDSISAATREKVLRLAKEHNYTPYSSLVASVKKSFTISVILKDTNYYPALLDGILKSAASSGYSVSLVKLSGETDEEKALSLAHTNGSSAVLLEHNGNVSPKLKEALEEQEVPVLLFSPFSNDSSGINISILSARLTELLIEMGHRDILCMAGEEDRFARSFFSGYAESLLRHGMPYRSHRSQEITPEILRKISTKSLSAVICPDYSTSLTVHELLTKQNFSIPETVSLVSLYGGNETRHLGKAISAIRIPFYEFGEFVCSKLIRTLEKSKKKFDETKFLLPELPLTHHASVDRPFSKSDKKILVLGSLNIDTYLQFDRLPETSSLMKTEHSSIYPGGKATNMAVGVAKLGHSVEILGAVGNDATSYMIFNSLRDHHIEHRNLLRFSDVGTGKCYTFTDKNGGSLVSLFSGANERFSAELLKKAEASFSNVSYCLISTEIPPDTALEACLLAHRYGAKTVLKPSALSPLSPSLIKEADLFVPNLSELQRMFPKTTGTEEMLDRLIELGAKEVILTLDSEGCLYKTKDSLTSFQAADFPLVDGTGGSDAFISTLVSCLLYGYEMESSIKAANYAAGHVISKEGVVPSLIDKKTLDEYIRTLGH